VLESDAGSGALSVTLTGFLTAGFLLRPLA